MKSPTTYAAAGATLLLLLAACSSGSNGPGGAGGGGACAEYFNAFASYLERCGDEQNTQSARSRFETVCANGLAAPGASNLGAQLSACSKKLASTSCNAEFDCEPESGTLEDGAACGEGYQCKSGSCKRVEGTSCGTCAPRIALGAACTRSSDCVEGARCLLGREDEGKCVPVKTANAGEPCTSGGGEIVECAEGLTCSFTGETRTCKAPGAAGAECTSRLDCAEGLRCVQEKCAAPLEEGAACELDDCAKGLQCGEDKKCARITLVKIGESCDGTRQCERGSCRGMSIESGPEGTVVRPGKCVEPLPDGAACSKDDEESPGCDIFAECIGGRCTLPNPALCK